MTDQEDIHSVVSDNSIGGLELHSSYPDKQASHALPYEVAVFRGQSLFDDTQTLQYTTDSKAALQSYDEVDHNKHNQQYQESQSSNQIESKDENHVYDDTNHKAKEGQSKSTNTLNKTEGSKNAATNTEPISYAVTVRILAILL